MCLSEAQVCASFGQQAAVACDHVAFSGCRMYGKPITDGQDRNATTREREVGAAIGEPLSGLLLLTMSCLLLMSVVV
jgi:hypothetical protein